MNIQLGSVLISELDAQAQKVLATPTSDAVGRVFHENLLRSILRKDDYAGTAFAVTDQRLMTATLNFETHPERALAAREAGRAFSVTAVEGDERLMFIGATAVGINHAEDEEEVALTFVQDLRPMHSVTVEDEFIPAFKNSEVRLFLDELSKSGRITTVNDGDVCIPKEEYDSLSEANREGFTTASNSLLFESFIGATYAFQFCRDRAAAAAA